MSASPGHKKWPDHKVIEEHPKLRYQLYFNDKKIVDSTDVIKVEEDGHPDRYYISREDVQMDLLERTSKTTECPFKGMAHYYTLKVGDQTLEDVVWTYETPFDEHKDLKNRLAFYEDKVDVFKSTLSGEEAA